tara:strand:+ start:325 stop:783 length:459 start_codon:yes stop_codon:yes gene_type:complete
MSKFFPDEENIKTTEQSNSLITTHSSQLTAITESLDIVENDESFENLLNNPFFTDLAEIMNNREFSTFFDKYFKDKEEIQTTLLYMKLYREIQIKYKEKKKEEIENITTLYVINVIMNTPELRRNVIKSMSEQYKDTNQIKKAISDSNLLTR